MYLEFRTAPTVCRDVHDNLTTPNKRNKKRLKYNRQCACDDRKIMLYMCTEDDKCMKKVI